MKKQAIPITPIETRLFSSCSDESGYLSQASEAAANASPFEPIMLATPDAMDTTEDKKPNSSSPTLSRYSFFSSDKTLSHFAQRVREKVLRNPVASHLHLMDTEEPLRFDKPSILTKREHEEEKDERNFPSKATKINSK